MSLKLIHFISYDFSYFTHCLPYNPIHRSRLSLDLSSPNTNNTVIDLPKLVTTPTTTTTTTKISTPTSPLVANSAPFPSRYTEFKTYSSTFDGLQALENHANVNNSNNNSNGTRASSSQVNTSPDNNPLMRVSSLPAIPPQNQLTGNYLCIDDWDLLLHVHNQLDSSTR